MRMSKKDLEKFLSRPMGLVAEYKTPIDFAKEGFREIDIEKEAFSRKNRHVFFINGKAFVKETL